jgi:2-keto-4-pentenoate hydratase/2-oxohepta-3-ene-1,7-dioic acid hydratase in catechol pathway
MALGRPAWRETRSRLQALIAGDAFTAEELNPLFDRIFVPAGSVQMVLPVSVGDYTDFYASKEHATNVGTMFRGKDNALMPNWYILMGSAWLKDAPVGLGCRLATTGGPPRLSCRGHRCAGPPAR